MVDPRYISAASFLVIGVVLIAFVVRVWHTHPLNRVFAVGPYVTDEGLRLLLRNLPMVAALGFFALTAGLAKAAYALRWKGDLNGTWADIFGTFEAIFAVWAASCVVVAAWRLCRKG